MANSRAVILDRDGTINRDPGFVHRVADLELLPGAVEGLRRMAAAGYRLIIATNQSGVARGYFTVEQMHAFNAALVELLASQGVTIDAVYCCPFHPQAEVRLYRADSPLRKPAPGMLLRAAEEQAINLASSIVVGDKLSDIAAGRAAGCRTILVRTGVAGSDVGDATPDYTVDDLPTAAATIEQLAARTSHSQGQAG